MSNYHYGKTIREYREKKNMSLSKLAALWPSKETGVTSRYVSDIERDIKHISDVSLLRDLARILDIPLWKFGLSEYNPFQELEDNLQQTYLTDDLTLLESLIQQIWVTKVTSGINIDTHIVTISNHVSHIIHTYPTSILDNSDFMRIYAQVKRLQAIRTYDNRHYEQAIHLFSEMKDIAERSNNPVSLALSHMAIGVELMRANNLDTALSYLLKAHDFTFETGKELASLVSGMLARYYARQGDLYNFEKYLHHAITLGQVLGNNRLNMTDYVFTSLSGVMEEGSNGYILLNNGKKALEYLPQIESQIEKESNIYLDMWLPLDYAQALLCLGEIEESLKHLRAFYDKTRLMRTPHIKSRMIVHINEIETLGYGELPEIKDFRAMLLEK